MRADVGEAVAARAIARRPAPGRCRVPAAASRRRAGATRRLRGNGAERLEPGRARRSGPWQAPALSGRAPDRPRRHRADWRRSGRIVSPGTASNQEPRRQSMCASPRSRAFCSGDFERGRRDIDAGDRAAAAVRRRWRARWRRCRCPRSRTAQDGQPMAGRRVDRAGSLQRQLDQQFGFRPRHQHGRRHVERQRPKFARARQVGDRRAPQAPAIRSA